MAPASLLMGLLPRGPPPPPPGGLSPPGGHGPPPPPGPPPPVIPPGAVNDSVGPQLLAIYNTFAGVAFLAVALRLYVRRVLLKTFGVDDAFMCLAAAMGVACLICFILEIQAGVGRHAYFLTLGQNENIQHITYFHSIFIVIGISSVKLSIAFLLLRIVNQTHYKRILWGMVVFLILFTIACVLTLVLSCIPPAANWDFSLRPTAVCFSIQTFTGIGLFNTSVNIATDLAFAILPIPVVWSLRLNRKSKISLIFILSLGFFACVASMIKLSVQIHILSDPDFTRSDSYTIWNGIEFFTGIIAACLPYLRPLFKAMLDTTKPTGYKGDNYYARASSRGNGTNGTGGGGGGGSRRPHSGGNMLSNSLSAHRMSRHGFLRQQDTLELDDTLVSAGRTSFSQAYAAHASPHNFSRPVGGPGGAAPTAAIVRPDSIASPNWRDRPAAAGVDGTTGEGAFDFTDLKSPEATTVAVGTHLRSESEESLNAADEQLPPSSPPAHRGNGIMRTTEFSIVQHKL